MDKILARHMGKTVGICYGTNHLYGQILEIFASSGLVQVIGDGGGPQVTIRIDSIHAISVHG